MKELLQADKVNALPEVQQYAPIVNYCRNSNIIQYAIWIVHKTDKLEVNLTNVTVAYKKLLGHLSAGRFRVSCRLPSQLMNTTNKNEKSVMKIKERIFDKFYPDIDFAGFEAKMKVLVKFYSTANVFCKV